MATLCSRCTQLQLSVPPDAGPPPSPKASEPTPDTFIDTGYVLRDTLPGLPTLGETARLGCAVCRLFIEAIRQDQRDQDPDEPENADWPPAEEMGECRAASAVAVYRMAAPSSRHELEAQRRTLSSLELRFTIDMPDERRYSPVLCFAISTKSSCAVARDLSIQRRSLSSTTLSSENTSMIRSWMDECRNGHESETGARSDICWANGAGSAADPTTARCPRRLVYVGGSGGDDSDIPRLVETSGCSPPYAALSYCWGKGEYLQTRKGTLRERKEGILWVELPRCHRDACVVTRVLGLDYVWIDALCIVQDDAEDWAREAAAMGPIYQAAHVTLCAAKSASSDEGFLHRDVPPRQPNHRAWKKEVDRSQRLAAAIPYCNPASGVSGHYHLRHLSLLPMSHTHLGADSGAFSAEVEESVWNTRGWTLQERQLSSRILFFGAASLFFECQALSRCEASPALTRRTTPWQDVALLRDDDRRGAGVLLRSAWTTMSMRMCSRRFTYRKDILPALAALSTRFTREMQATLGGGSPEPVRCIAGLWDACLLDDLLWICRGWSSRFHAPRSEGVPTWSWLSLRATWQVAGEWLPHGNEAHVVRGEVGYQVLDSPGSDGPRLAAVCEVLRTPESVPSRDGDASLWLRGPIARQEVSCRRGATTGDWTPFSVGGARVEIALDCDHRLPRQRGMVVEEPDREMRMPVYLAAVFRGAAGPGVTPGASVPAGDIYGLVLGVEPGGSSGEDLHRLRRVGVFRAGGGVKVAEGGLGLVEKEYHIW